MGDCVTNSQSIVYSRIRNSQRNRTQYLILKRWQESTPTLKALALVSVGGIAGTLSRFGLGEVFPNDRAGTLAANLIGVALAAILLVVMERRGITELRLLLMPGFCAGLTTFSAVTAQSLEPRDGGTIFLLQNLVFSLVIVVVLLPLARKLVPVRS